MSSCAPLVPARDGIIDEVKAAIGDAFLSAKDAVGEVSIDVARDRIADVIRTLRDRFEYQQLMEIAGVDYPERVERFEVVYHLLSIPNRARLRLKVRVADGDRIPTVQGVWRSAAWLEREVYDMFGIIADGHPDLRRLLMPEDWEGHPARKDYPVQIRKVAQTYSALEVTEEEFKANLERDRVGRTKH